MAMPVLPRIFILLLFQLLLEDSNINCFVLPSKLDRFRPVLFSSSIFLAKKAKKKKSSSGSSAGAGFGSKPSTPPPETKVRSVSGFTGSGTKPLRVAANTFDKLRKDQDPACSSDVYIRAVDRGDPDTFWFAGKVARQLSTDDLVGTSVPTPQEAVRSQKRLILEYAKHQLRPQNFALSKDLEIWIAPGDSEMDVVQNKIALEKVTGSVSDLSDGFHVADVGFNPEIYLGDELEKGGLRVKRDDEGKPLKAVFDINQSA